MLQLRDIYRIQSEYGVSDGSFRGDEITFEQYVNECRIFLKDNFPIDFSKLDFETKQTTTINTITKYCDLHKVPVQGYIAEGGKVDYELLLNDVVDAVAGEGVLKDALIDPEVDEIQINDKNTLFIQKGGVLVPYLDHMGRPRQFASDTEIHIVLSRLMSDGKGNSPHFAEGDPILNTKTAKHHYRISAVHPIANASAPEPFNFDVTSVVIRKFKAVKLTVDDLVRNGALTKDMGELLKYLGRAGINMFFVGPTGCGKTTQLNIVAGATPVRKRILLVQNPTEISFFERDEYGRALRNVVHWEVVTQASLEDLANNSLRFTPEITIVGESRTSSEFSMLYSLIQYGQTTFGSFHAESCMGGLYRFASEVARETGDSKREILEDLCNSIDVLVATYRFPDGTRRTMEIAEVRGFVDGKPDLNILYEFRVTGEITTNEYGLQVVHGDFYRTGVMSMALQKKCFKAGVSSEELEPYTRPLKNAGGEIAD